MTAPPLVFVHGFACDRTDWRAQADSLASRTTVVEWELPGHALGRDRVANTALNAAGDQASSLHIMTAPPISITPMTTSQRPHERENTRRVPDTRSRSV